MLQSRSWESESRESKVFTGSRKKDFAGVGVDKYVLDSRLPLLHKNLIKMLATSCVDVTVVKFHVAVARRSLAAAVYAYIYIFTILNGFVIFVFSVLSYYANLTKIRAEPRKF